MWVINADGTNPVLLVPGTLFMWLPHENRIMFSDSGGLWSMKPDGTDRVKFPAVSNRPDSRYFDADLRQLALELGFRERADRVRRDGAVGTDEERLRQRVDAVAERDLVVGIEPDRPVGVLLVDELLARRRAGRAGVDADHLVRAGFDASVDRNSGNSLRHGVHQDAQKFSTTGLPR